MKALYVLFSLCLVAFTTCSSPAQSASSTPSLGQSAVSFVVETSSIDPSALVADTGKPLPGNGHWGISKARPAACPKGEVPCARVLYSVPEENVTCEWVVIPPAGDMKGQILDENESASQYLLRRLSASEAAPLIKSRTQPRYPPIAEAAHVSGVVVVRVVVSPVGDVQNTVLLSGPEMLRAAALDAIRKWTFTPLKAGTHASAFTTEITTTFATRGPSSGSTVKFLP